MPTRRTLEFVVSQETDPGFQQALKRLHDDFGNWKIVSLTRVEQNQNGIKVPVCVITVEL
jgi:hypothetical protein